MHLQKTKDYSSIDLQAVKTHLQIVSGDTSYDTELEHLIKAAVNIAENYIGQSIVPTTTLLTDNCIHGIYYTVPEPDIIISGITATTEAGETKVITGFKQFKYASYTLLEFKNSLNAEVLEIEYKSGYQEIPADILAALFIKIGELFDGDRSGLIPTNVRESKTFYRLLTPYLNMI